MSDPWIVRFARKPNNPISKHAMKGHTTPTNVGSSNFPTDPQHDKRVPLIARRLLKGRH